MNLPACKDLQKRYEATLSEQQSHDFPNRRLLTEMVEAKGRSLSRHSSGAAWYGEQLAAHAGLSVSNSDYWDIHLGASLHDIGLVAFDIPKARIGLAEGEPEFLWDHPEVGSKIVTAFGLPTKVAQIILYHHERYDGSGYPYGLYEEGIPVLARVVAIAQEFSHLTVEHRLIEGEACKQLIQEKGRRFDPGLTDLFVSKVAALKG